MAALLNGRGSTPSSEHFDPDDVRTFSRLKWGVFHMNRVMGNLPLEKTVSAALRWFDMLKAVETRINDLSGHIAHIPEGCKPLLTLALKKASLIMAHLTLTLEGRATEEPYFLKQQVLDDAEHLSIHPLEKGPLLGRGLDGSVYEVTIGAEKRCMKVPTGIRATIDEAIAYSKLPEHPGVLTAGLIVEEPKSGYLLLKKAEKNCDDLFRDISTKSRNTLLDFFQITAKTLSFIGKEGYVFLDFKPSNVLYLDGRLVLSDLSMLTKIGDTLAAGTLGFAAPEIWASPATPAADVFSFGAVLFYAVTGKYILTETNPDDALFELRSLKETDLTRRFEDCYPTDASKEFCSLFGTFSYEWLSLIPYIQKNREVCTRISDVIRSIPTEDRKELAKIIADSIEAGAPPSRKEALALLEASEKSFPAHYIAQLLLISDEKRDELLDFITRSGAKLNAERVRATLVDPDGEALHLARYLLRIDPKHRPEFSSVLRHPYFKSDQTCEEWALAFPAIAEASYGIADTIETYQEASSSASTDNPFATGATDSMRRDAYASALAAWAN